MGARMMLHRWHGLLAHKQLAQRAEELASAHSHDIQRLQSAAIFFKRLKQERHVNAVLRVRNAVVKLVDGRCVASLSLHCACDGRARRSAGTSSVTAGFVRTTTQYVLVK